MNGTRPSEQLRALLTGQKKKGDVSQAVLSWATLMVYKKACQILEMPKPERESEIDKAPQELREDLKNEVVRIYNIRRINK